MNTLPPDDNELDDVTAAYRRASAADASHPSEQTRAAIFAEAHRVAANAARNSPAARTAQPAANDSWWNWKIAAGLATLGLAGVLTVQTLRVEPQPPEPRLTESVAQSSAESLAVAPPTAAVPTTALPASAEMRLSKAVADQLATASTVPQRSGSDTELSLINAYFPAAFGAQPDGPRPWLLLDGAGKVLRTGSFGADNPTELRRYLESAYPGILITEVRNVSVSNEQGQSASVSFVSLAQNSALPITQSAPELQPSLR